MTATFIPAHEALAAGIVVPVCARCRRKLRGKEKDDGTGS